MKKLLLFISLLTGTTSFTQTKKTIEIPSYQNSKNSLDTSLWYISTNKLRQQINLSDLIGSVDTFHFRFWTDIQAVDIWTIDHHLYNATVTNYAQRYNSKLLHKSIYEIDKIFSNQVKLDSSKARQIFNLIDTLSIINIPTDDKIPGWAQGFDGEEFIIETSTPSQYNFKTYWTPRIFADTLKEAKQIQTLVDKLYDDFKIDNYYQKLKLPEGSYKRNGIQGIRISSSNEPVIRNSIFDFF